MSVCRLNWPYRRTLRFLDKATREPKDWTGAAFTLKVFESWGGATLATWTSAAGQVVAAAGGRIVIDVAAADMVAPLRAGTFPMELRRTDGAVADVILTGLITVGKAVTT